MTDCMTYVIMTKGDLRPAARHTDLTAANVLPMAIVVPEYKQDSPAPLSDAQEQADITVTIKL